MSSSKSSRRRLEGSVKIKLNRSAKESSNGRENSEDEPITLNESGSEDSAASKEYRPKIRKESQTLNKSVLALPDDLKKLIDRVTCCSCGKQLNVMNAGAVRKHPWLKVVTCKKCYKFLRSGPFTRDDDGTDEQCRWCGDGGRLYGCDFCHNCFCRSCIKRNLGRSEATKMEDDDGSKWHCYMCKPKRIGGLVSDCNKILDYIAREEKKDKEAEERRAKREKEKAAAHAAKVKEEKKKSGEDSEKKGDKGSAKKGFPAPKDKSQVAVKSVEIKGEKKEEKSDKKPDASNIKKDGPPDLIVLDDSPMKISQHHRARAYKPDQTTGVKQVQKSTNGVLEVTVGPKNSKAIVNTVGGRPQQPSYPSNANRSLLAGVLSQNVGGSGGYITNKKPPPNDLMALKNNILPLNIDAAIEKMMPMTQSFNLSLNSVKTDIAIAKLSQVNMYHARQRACSQIKNSLEYYLNGIRDVWGVQLVANTNAPTATAAEGSGDTAANLLKAVMGLPSTDPKITSTPIKSNESQPAPKLNESIIPIELDSPKVAKDKKSDEEVMEVDNESDNPVCIDTPKKETGKGKSEEPESVEKETGNSKDNEGESAEKQTEKDKSEEPEDSGVDDKKSADVDDKVNGDGEGDTEENMEDNAETEEDEAKKDEIQNSEKDKDADKDDEVDAENSEKDDEIDTKNSSKKSAKVDEAEKSGAEEDTNQNSENTAAELELLKEMADELNEKEDSDEEEEEEEEAQPRRSGRSRKVVEPETRDDEDSDSPKRRSSRHRSKPEDKSDAKSDKTSDKTKSERQSRRSRTTESEKTKEKSKTKDVDEEENMSTEEEQVKTKSKKGTDSHYKSDKKSKQVTESDEDTVDEKEEKEEKSRSKRSDKAKDEKTKSKHEKSKDSGEDTVDEEKEEKEEKSRSKRSDKAKDVKTKSKHDKSKDSGEDTEDEEKEEKEEKSRSKRSDKAKDVKTKSKPDKDSGKDTEEEEEEKEEKSRSKRSDKAKDVKTKSKHDKSKNSDEGTEEESDSKGKTKGKDKDTKHANKSKESKKKHSKDQEDDDSTEVEGEKAEDKTKKKSPVKDKKKSPSKKGSKEENLGADDDIPTEESDTSDSSEESFEEFGKKRKTRKKTEKKEKSEKSEKKEESKGTRRSSRRATRQRDKKSTEEEPSDSDPDFDKDLEKEIKSLSKETRLSRKKKSDKDSKKESKQTKEDKKAKDKKKSAKQEVSDEEEDDDEEDENEDRNEEMEENEDGNEEMEDLSDLSSAVEMPSDDLEESEDDTDNLSASQLKKLKQAGKAALEASDDDEDVIPENISSDSSDPEVSFPKLSTPKKGKKHAMVMDMDVSDDSDFITPKKKKRIKSKLLDAKISDSDDSDSDKKGKKGKKGKRKRKGNSDDFSELSDEEENRKKGKGKKRRRIKKVASSDEEKIKEPGEDDEVSGSDDEENTPGGHLKRKKIRRVIGSGKLKDATKAAQKEEELRRKRIEERQKEYNTYVEVEGGEEEEETEELPDGTEREHATPVKADTDSIAKILGSPRKVPVTTKCVLEMDKAKKKTIIEIDRTLVKKLKPHQVEAVRFMYNCCVETIETKDKGSGCILAHCMGLGKTLSVITFVHTMLSNQKLTKMTKCLVVCPLNTVLNWVNEFEIWLDDVDFEIEVYELSRVKQNFERAQMLKEWSEGGAGVLIIGYDMYRNLVSGTHCRNAKQKKIFYSTLADPGPDITVCDEGHILKNDQTTLSKAMMKIKSAKRVVLTGTPLQNNLGEYHCMVNFVKPSLLGTRKEFNNRFNNPITNGQCKDSTAFDVKLMKRRAHILHELLAGCVQRKDYSALTKFLPPKFEYVISVRLAPVQMQLYEKYLEMTRGEETASKGARLFRDYQALMRIWTHPWVLKLDEIRQENKRQFDSESEDSFVDDSDGKDSFVNDSDSDSFRSSTSPSGSDSESDAKGKKKKKKTRGGRGKASSSSDESKKENPDEVVKKWTSRRRGNEEGAGSSWMDYMGYGGVRKEKDETVTSEWWAEYVKETDESRLDISGKLVLLFEILKMCEDIGDKVLVFSQSLLSLDIIEDFLMKVDEAQGEAPDAEKPSSADDKDKPSTSGEKEKTDTSDKKDADVKSDEASASGEGTEVKEKTEAEKNKERLAKYCKNWTKGADYFRMDGSTNSVNRKASQDMFNDPENYRARLFLISTKAGSLGINLVSANRVIIFDASWNPSHDIQSIFRVYRFGQVKPVYVYRFLAQGTMEEKIYERQVTKQSLSQRVVDEHQIARHFTSNDLQELYKFQPDRLDDPEKKDKPLPMLPKDHMLAELMTNDSEWIVTYHEHDSLLENVVEQELNEEEKKAAWEDYENEKKGLNRVQQMMGGSGLNPAVYATQQMSMQNLLLQGQANLGQAAVLQIVQDLKARFPSLPPEVFQQRVQAVLRQVLTQQIMQQSAMQRQQVEQQRLNELNRLNQMKQQIQRQQAMINGPQNMYSIGQQSLLTGMSGAMSGLRPQTLNQLSVQRSIAPSVNRSNAPIDLTGQTSSTKK